MINTKIFNVKLNRKLIGRSLKCLSLPSPITPFSSLTLKFRLPRPTSNWAELKVLQGFYPPPSKTPFISLILSRDKSHQTPTPRPTPPPLL